MPRPGKPRSSSALLPSRVAFPPPFCTPWPATPAYPIKGLCFAMKPSMRERRAFSARRGLRTAIRLRGPSVEQIEVTIRDIDSALSVVREVAWPTPTVPFSGGDEPVWLKLENLQRLGAFKIRGVWNRISHLTEADRVRGISTISSGNHGLAVAWAARRLGLPCTVRVPEGAVGRKVEAIRAQGADVSPISRSDLIDAHEKEAWQSWPSVFLHPFAHPAAIAGQEPAGAAAFAAWIRYRDQLRPPVVAVVSGGNVDPNLLAEVVKG